MDPVFARFMHRALALAAASAQEGEVPVGAVVVQAGNIVGEGRNRPRAGLDPCWHAEIAAIRDAARRLERDRLDDCDLWVSLEPCAMCAGAIAHARIARLYYGAPDAKGGAVEHGPRLFAQPTVHHRPEIYGGLCAAEAGEQLRAFFRARR